MTPCEITSPELPAATFVGCAALRRQSTRASVIAVGHQPFMSMIASHLLGIYVGGFPTAAAYHIALDRGTGDGAGELRWRWVGAFID